MLDQLINIDTQALLTLNSFHTPWLDCFVYTFSSKGIWIPMYAMLLLTYGRVYPRLRLLFVLLGVALSITLADQICATLIRPAIERMRPSNPLNPLSALVTLVNDYRGGQYGFPSCHAANSFALAGWVWVTLRSQRIRTFILVWAVLNSLSRCYLGVHYPGDLLAGAIIGTGCGLLSALLFNLTLRRIWSETIPGTDIISRSGLYVPLNLNAGYNILRIDTLAIPVSVWVPVTGVATVLYIAVYSYL